MLAHMLAGSWMYSLKPYRPLSESLDGEAKWAGETLVHAAPKKLTVVDELRASTLMTTTTTMMRARREDETLRTRCWYVG